jgi:hypothetical protein
MKIGYPDALVVHPHKEDVMFMAGARSRPSDWRQAGTADSGIARSRDGGRTWQLLSHGLPEHVRPNVEVLLMDIWNGSFALFAATSDGQIFRSEDEGNQWSRIVNGLPPICKERGALRYIQ